MLKSLEFKDNVFQDLYFLFKQRIIVKIYIFVDLENNEKDVF